MRQYFNIIVKYNSVVIDYQGDSDKPSVWFDCMGVCASFGNSALGQPSRFFRAVRCTSKSPSWSVFCWSSPIERVFLRLYLGFRINSIIPVTLLVQDIHRVGRQRGIWLYLFRHEQSSCFRFTGIRRSIQRFVWHSFTLVTSVDIYRHSTHINVGILTLDTLIVSFFIILVVTFNFLLHISRRKPFIVFKEISRLFSFSAVEYVCLLQKVPFRSQYL